MTFYSNIKKDNELYWNTYIGIIYYKINNRYWCFDSLNLKTTQVKTEYFKSMINRGIISEISKELVLEYMDFIYNQLNSDYNKAMCEANGEDDSVRIAYILKFVNKLKGEK